MTSTCPSCGAPANGKFCGQCGARLAPVACAQCGATVQAGARFCGTCGTPVGTVGKATGGAGKSMLPFAMAAGAGLVVALIIAYRGGQTPAAATVAAPEAPFAAQGGGGTPPDLSKMS